MESIDSSTCSLQLPPGFRFHPTDEELVVHYLKKKANSLPLPASIIAEIDLYKFDPWELPAKASFGEEEWYFFSPRYRKYPNGSRPNRAATSGYWKATGTDKPVLTARGTQKVGVKKALVFYQGKPPKGIKTNWIMHEYRLMDNNKTYSLKPPGCDHLNKKGSLRLDDWVLCRIYKKNNMQRPFDSLEIREDHNESMMIGSIPPSLSQNRFFQGELKNSNNYASFHLENDHQHMYERINFPAKRTLQNLYWNINEDSSSSKRPFLSAENHHDNSNIINGRLNDDQQTNCMATSSTILSHLPQSSSDDQAVLGATNNNFGDNQGVLGQQQFNWYT